MRGLTYSRTPCKRPPKITSGKVANLGEVVTYERSNIQPNPLQAATQNDVRKGVHLGEVVAYELSKIQSNLP